MNIHKRVAAMLLTLTLLAGSFSISAFASGSIVSGIGFITGSSLNLRMQPSTDSGVLATANANECVVILSQEGEWYHVNYNLQEGYMNAAYLNVSSAENAELGYGRVNGSSVNLRTGPDTSYPKAGTVNLGETCYIIGLNNGWYKVIYQSTTAYIRSDFVDLTEIPYENRASSNSPQYFRGGKSIGALPASASAGVSSAPAAQGYATGAQIVEKARQYLGTPYVYGGASPSGFDCSGFVYYVFGTFGYSVGRTPAAQNEIGSHVDKSDLQPGDIVLFAGTGGSGITHSGIYVGGGQFIHSPNSRSTVSYSDLSSGYWSDHFYCGRRVV